MTTENEPIPPMGSVDTDKEIYKQDAEFYRYQDRLRWSRFQTIVTIEGAWLLVLFTDKIILEATETSLLAMLGFLIVFIQCLLSLKDELAGNRHLDRLAKIEQEWGRIYGTSPARPTDGTFGDRVARGIQSMVPSGSTLGVTTIALLTVFNLGVLIVKAGLVPTIIMVGGLILLWGIMSCRWKASEDRKTSDIQP